MFHKTSRDCKKNLCSLKLYSRKVKIIKHLRTLCHRLLLKMIYFIGLICGR